MYVFSWIFEFKIKREIVMGIINIENPRKIIIKPIYIAMFTEGKNNNIIATIITMRGEPINPVNTIYLIDLPSFIAISFKVSLPKLDDG